MKKTKINNYLTNSDLVLDLFWNHHQFSKVKTIRNGFWLKIANSDWLKINQKIYIKYQVSDPKQWTFSINDLKAQEQQAILINDLNLKNVQIVNGMVKFSPNWQFPDYQEHIVGWQCRVLKLKFSNDRKQCEVVLQLLKPGWIKPIKKLKIFDCQEVIHQYLSPLELSFFNDLIELILLYIAHYHLFNQIEMQKKLARAFKDEILQAQKLHHLQKIDDQTYFYILISTLNKYYGKWWDFNLAITYCDQNLLWLSCYEHWKKRLDLINQIYLKKVCDPNQVFNSKTYYDTLDWMNTYLKNTYELDNKYLDLIQHLYQQQLFGDQQMTTTTNLKNNPSDRAGLPSFVEQRINQLEADMKASNRQDVYGLVIRTIKNLPWLKYQMISSPKTWKTQLDQVHLHHQELKNKLLGLLAKTYYLQTYQLTNNESKILCLVGPPGVGKTTIVNQLATISDLPLIKIACATINHSEDLYGMDPGWSGARSGKIINGLLKVQVNNPIILLDEIDKVDQNRVLHAWLDLLDPHNNQSFTDLFIDTPFDLKNVLFIATANDLKEIHPALVDRLDVVYVENYSEAEVLEIVKKVMIPDLLKQYQKVADSSWNDTLQHEAPQIVKKYYQKGLRKIRALIDEFCLIWLVQKLKI